jgi:hypothetical protein
MRLIDGMSTEDATVNSSQATGIPMHTALAQAMPDGDVRLYPTESPEPAETVPSDHAAEDQASESASLAAQEKKYIAYTIKLPSEQLSALQSIWLELKRLYGVNSPDKSGMIQQAVAYWLKEWDSSERTRLLNELLEIREDTRRRQYRKSK